MPEIYESFLKFVNAEYREALGQVVVQAGLLEAMLEAAIWQAASVRNDVGRTLTANLMMAAKLELLQGLLHQTHPAVAPHFDDMASYIKQHLNNRRNVMVHGMWFQLPGAEELASIVKFSSRGRLT